MLRTILLTTAVGLLLLTGATPAQQLPFGSRDHEDRIGIDAAGAFVQMRDDQVVRIRHDGAGLDLRLFADLAGASNLHTIALSGSVAGLANRYGTGGISVGAALQYGYAVRVPAWSEDKVSVYLGGMLSAATDVQFFEPVDESHIFWLTQHDLRIRALLRYGIGESGSLTADLGLPVVALVSRPPSQRYYNNDMPRLGYIFSKVHEDLKFETLDRFQALDLRLGYAVDLSDRFSESIAYELRFRRSTDPDLYLSLAHGLRVSLAYTL